jgi:transitional endoplasmic reticulum ATPase
MNKYRRPYRRRSNGCSVIVNTAPLPAPAKLFVLRLLVQGGVAKAFVTDEGYSDPLFAGALGLDVPDLLSLEFDAAAARRDLQALYDKAEAEALVEDADAEPSVLEANVADLAEAASLSPLACEILALAVLLKTAPALGALNDLLGPLDSVKLTATVASMLATDAGEVRAELAMNGALHTSGLLRVDRSENYSLGSKLDLISSDFAERIVSERCPPLALLHGCISAAPASELGMDDYAHMPVARRLVSYLNAVTTQKRKGSTVLIHGAPGLGKTQLARAAGAAAGLPVFEVAACGTGGKMLNGDARLAAYRAAQRLLAQRPAVLVFDEFEDASDLRMARFNDNDVFSKGALNEMLETTPVPTIVITNNIEDIDRAHLRRFDLIIEAKAPPSERRRELVRAAAGGYASDEMIDSIVEEAAASPAIIKRATDVVELVAHGAEAEERREVFRDVLGGMLQAQAGRVIELGARPRAADPSSLYDANLANADIDLVELANASKTIDGSRIMLYGPPGTGKTAFGNWLAREIGAPLFVKRASDLLHAHVGVTEERIAEAFSSAREEGAVLLIDECDSFLRSRMQARTSWEQTMTNELLTQMESYPGVLVLTTNMIDSLDEAVMRRIDFKVKLDCLKPEQVRALLVRYCEFIGIEAPDEVSLQRAGNLRGIAPGDFALLARQARLRRITTSAEFVTRLEAETRFKRDSGARRSIGFVGG